MVWCLSDLLCHSFDGDTFKVSGSNEYKYITEIIRLFHHHDSNADCVHSTK